MHGTSQFDVVSYLRCRSRKKFFKVQCKETKRLYTMEVVLKNDTTMSVEKTSPAAGSHVNSISSGNLTFCTELKFFFETDLKFYCVLDYVGEINLEAVVKEYDRLSENAVLFIAAELAIALRGLHDRGIGYGELSLDTVMLDSNGHVVLWREFIQKEYWDVCECLCSLPGLNCGNPRHAGERHCRDQPYSNGSLNVKPEAMKEDWHCLGAIVYTLLVGSLLEKEPSVEEVLFPEWVTPITEDFINGLLKGNIQSFEEVKTHRYFTSLDWKDVESKSLTSPFSAGHRSKENSTMSHQLSKHPSLTNVLTGEVHQRQGCGLYSTKPSLSRSYSCDLRCYSSNSNLTAGARRRSSATPTHCLLFPDKDKDTRKSQMGTSRNRTPQVDHYTLNGEINSRLKSNFDRKSMTENRASHIYSTRPSYVSAPKSPRQSIVETRSLNSSYLTNILDQTTMSHSDISHQKSPGLISSTNDLSRSHGTLQRSQSSTDLVPEASSSTPGKISDKPWQEATLNRSWSFSNLREASRDLHIGTSGLKSFAAVDQNIDFNTRSTEIRQSGKRSLAWTPIPSFEEFRAMRSRNQTRGDGHSHNYNNDNQYLDDKRQQQFRAVEHATGTESLYVQMGERKKASFSSNPVIQELLVKYGLTKTSNVKDEPAQNTRVSITAADPVQTETTSSKRRLLSIVDEFLANRNKEKSLSTSKSMSEIRKPKFLRERRTVSSPRMALSGKYQLNDSRSSLNKDVHKDLGNRENVARKIGDDCDQDQERSLCPSAVDVPEQMSEKAGNSASQDVLGWVQCQTNNADRGDKSLHCHSKVIDKREIYETYKRKGKRENAKKKSTERCVPETQQNDEKTQAVCEQQPEKISLGVSCSNVVLGLSKKSKAFPFNETQERAVISRGIIGKKRNIPKRKRASSELVKECVRKEEKGRVRSFSQVSSSTSKEDSSNWNSHAKANRTSSLLSLTDSVTSYDDFHDSEFQDELPRHERSSKRGVRSGSILSTNSDSDSPRRRKQSSRGSSFLSSVSDADLNFSRTESTSSLHSRSSSFMSNVSTDSGSIQLDYEDSDGDLFIEEAHVFHGKTESEIKRNDSGLGDEIGVTPRLKKRWEAIVDGSSQQWSIVASSARCWREMAIKKRERRLQQQQRGGVRKISHGRKNSKEKQPCSIDCPDCGRPFVVDKDKPSTISEGPKRSSICYKCQNHRVERKEAIIELVQTEINYVNDFQILKEEFLAPMQSGGIVSPDNLAKIFLNIQELLDVSMKFCKKIETSMEECIGKNDEEFCHMRVGKIFAESVEFFQAYELYCSKQPEAIRLLESLQKKSEVLRVFLNITCRENPRCRKMDINSFLLAPVQRVMKYPLLLNRIRSATPRWHGDREDLKLAQRKVEEQIAKINSLTKSSEIKPKKFLGNLGSSDSVDSSRLKKLACDVLSWTMDEIQLLMHGVLKVTCCEFGGIQSWTKRNIKRNLDTHLLFCIRGQNEPVRVDFDVDEDVSLLFPHISEVSDATLLLLKRKTSGKYTLFRNEIRLRDCVVYQESGNNTFGLIHMGKETFVFTARNAKDARRWLNNLRLQTKDQGKWRRRRNASANIMLKTS